MKVGVIGNGFVGNSIYHTFTPQFEVRVYDKNPARSTHTLEDVITHSDIVFMCLPTPMMKSGHNDLSYIMDSFEDINGVISSEQIEPSKLTFVIKSTVVPSTTERLASKYKLGIVFSPEFLTERTAVTDSICSNHAIVGGFPEDVNKVVALYKERFGAGYNVLCTNSRTAEYIKYMRNAFFATKVTFMNEMFRIGANAQVDWEAAVDGFSMDGRIGHSHLDVPGHDGMYGYGGTCFPKDVSAITQYAKNSGFDPILLEAIQRANLKYRGVEDWKDKVGRAVSEDTNEADDICHPDAIDGTDGACMECGSKDNL